MTETPTTAQGRKEDKYRTLAKQISAITENEGDIIANMANTASMLHETFGFWWTGFYRVIDGQLVLGPFQGPPACTRIQKGKGVCGAAWDSETTLIVANVEQFPGHIACSPFSKSEIVVPVRRKGAIVAVLDIDSDKLDTFDQTDKTWLEHIVKKAFDEDNQ